MFVGTIISTLTWFCLYTAIEMAASKLGGRANEKSNVGPPDRLAVPSVNHIEELPEPYLRALARLAILEFDKPNVEAGLRITDMALTSSDRDEILLAVVGDLLVSRPSSSFSGFMSDNLSPAPPTRPPSNASSTQRAEYEKEYTEYQKKLEASRKRAKLAEDRRNERNARQATIETIAGKISDPLKRATALSKFAVHLVSPMANVDSPDEEDADGKERESASGRDSAAALKALVSERNRRIQQRHMPDIPYFWLGTILFGLLGFLLMTFSKPVIEAFGKALGEAMVKDLDPVKVYDSLKTSVRLTEAGAEHGTNREAASGENAAGGHTAEINIGA
jgi:hypothetical protein